MQNNPIDRTSPISQSNFVSKVTLDISKNCKYQNARIIKASVLYTIKEHHNNIHTSSLKSKLDETSKNTLIMLNFTKENIIKNTDFCLDILSGIDLNKINNVKSHNCMDKLFDAIDQIFIHGNIPDKIKSEIIDDYNETIKEFKA